MGIFEKIQLAIQILNELKALKVALGFDESASIPDMIKQIKESADGLDEAAGNK